MARRRNAETFVVISANGKILLTAFFALFLGFNKRRGELALLEGKIGGTRKARRDKIATSARRWTLRRRCSSPE